MILLPYGMLGYHLGMEDVEQEAPVYTRGEFRPEGEYANLATHGLGLLLSVIGAVYLMGNVIPSGDQLTIIACGVYSFTLVNLYLCSTLSHAFHDIPRRIYYRTLDQAAIFLLIVGSYTPFSVFFLPDDEWPIVLAILWTLGFCGVALTFRLKNLPTSAKMLYGLLGCVPALVFYKVLIAAPPDLLFWILIGGVMYLTGTVFLALDHTVRYFHALWHVLVIAGSIAHYVAILELATYV